MVEVLRSSPYVRSGLFLAFLLGLWSLIAYAPIENSLYTLQPIFALGMAAILTCAVLTHFFVNHAYNFENNLRFTLFFGSILAHLGMLKFAFNLSEKLGWSPQHFLLFVPFALVALSLSMLSGRNVAVLGVICTSIIGCLLLPPQFCFPYLIINMLVGLVVILASKNVRKRDRLLSAGVISGLAATGLCLLYGLTPLEELINIGAPQWKNSLINALTPLMIGTGSALLLGGLLPLLETIFQSTTTISWIESADLNHPLLRRMTMECPGTYHHSLMVANMSVDAAEAVGANAAMTRVCAYFHDIGKLAKPEYFIENQGGGENPHDDLTPTMSALVITAHVKEGVDIAVKNHLKEEVIDVIEQHHGTSLIYSFYRKAVEQKEEAEAKLEEGEQLEEEVEEVDEKNFRYPGPKPQFRESAIISLADAAESASRSLKKPTPRRIRQLVNDIFESRILDGQLDESDMSFRELAVVKESFIKSLRSMLHRRIEYPDEREAQGERGERSERKESDSEKHNKEEKAEANDKTASPEKRTATSKQSKKSSNASNKSKNKKASHAFSAARSHR